MLEQEYQKNARWTTATISQLARRLQVHRRKVYKWGWDRRRREVANPDDDRASSSHHADHLQPVGEDEDEFIDAAAADPATDQEELFRDHEDDVGDGDDEIDL